MSLRSRQHAAGKISRTSRVPIWRQATFSTSVPSESEDAMPRVALMMDVPDMAAFATAMKSKEAADAMAFDGVVPESLVVLVES